MPDAPQAIKAIADADIETFAAGYRGCDLAKNYLAMPDKRDRITAIIENRPDNEQRQFVSLIRSNMQ